MEAETQTLSTVESLTEESADPNSTSSLLRRVHRGDSAALAELVARELPWVTKRVRERLGGALRARVESMDIVQDALLEFFRYGPRVLLDDRGQLRKLLARIVENSIRAQCDRQAADCRALDRELALGDVPALDFTLSAKLDPSASQLAVASERRAWLRLGLELLEPEDRELILRREWEEETFGEIGAAFGITADAARMRLGRAMARLAKVLRQMNARDISTFLDNDAERCHDANVVTEDS
ncbi:MAG: RNA polymerase sigma factor [Planctomycetota bacterium]